ncbi:MAG: Holliday junction branch migration protein RuvA [Agathobacter sp.]|nr:Holliday junction branch migration protein RuvA [Agathobacter sp.]
MYSYIKGELAEVNTDHIVVETGGIGYMVYVPAQSLKYLPSIGDDIKIYTYLYIREDAMILYGFLTKDDLEVFKLLITVSGIGPKGGLSILSTLSSDDLRFAILSGDSKAISKAPGIGSKTAQRVIIDLKDKMSLEEAFEKKLENTENALKMPEGNSAVKNDAVLALNALGYSSTESLKAVSKVEITEGMDVEDVLKQALKYMSIF